MFKEILEIYKIFFKIGAVTFGGGYAMLPILRREIIEKLGWVDEETVMDYYALSQGLPGIIAVNVAVFIGYKRRGIPGAVAGAFGVVSPCIVIITLIASCLASFKDNVYVRHALSGISVCVSALILDAVIGLWKKGVKDWFGIILCFAMLTLSLFTEISPILLVISSALLGIAVRSQKANGKAGGSEK